MLWFLQMFLHIVAVPVCSSVLLLSSAVDAGCLWWSGGWWVDYTCMSVSVHMCFEFVFTNINLFCSVCLLVWLGLLFLSRVPRF